MPDSDQNVAAPDADGSEDYPTVRDAVCLAAYNALTDKNRATCDWPMGTVWSGPRRCGKLAKFKVRSGPFAYDLRYVCGIHDRTLTNDGGGSEVITDD